MKINHRLNPWRNLSQKLYSFWSLQPKSLLAERRLLKPNNRFLSWPNMPKRMLCAQSGYELPPKVDLKVLERFLEKHKKNEGVSSMLATSLDDWQNFNVHQAIAVKKMASLIGETIAEMKMVEMTYNCHKKG
jgi:hypothetical protein